MAKQARRALAAEDALAFIAGDDPRPLLVIRECKVCNGTDRALLTPGADNERTLLLARWFHCVKLPMDVREEDHPFYALFPSKDAEHLFVNSRDGSLRLALESEGSRVELWEAMAKVVQAEYAKRPDAALKKIARILDQLDVQDERRLQLVDRRDEILEEEGEGSRKLRKVAEELAEIERDIAALRQDLAQASELELKRPLAAPEGAGEAAGASRG